MLSTKEDETLDPSADRSRSSTNSSHLSNASTPHDDGFSEEQPVVVHEASSSPNLENAITARWFAADLRNSTAAAAVHDEVSSSS